MTNIDDELVTNLALALFQGNKGGNFTGLSSPHIENVAFHDFSEYVYIIDPIILPTPPFDITQLPINEELEPADRLFLQDLETKIFVILEGFFMGNDPICAYIFPYHRRLRIINRMVTALIMNRIAYEELLALHTKARFISRFSKKVFIDSLTIVGGSGDPWNGFYAVDPEPAQWDMRLTDAVLMAGWGTIAENAKARWTEYLDNLLEEQRKKYIAAPMEIPMSYDFELYNPTTWNLGIRVVYRQEWRPLGNQRGEIVKTIPLGPKQVEKVTTKIIRRMKTTRTAETLKSVETTSEVTDTTKDSTEIVNEAAKTYGWNVEAEASVGFAGISAGVSGGSHEENEERSSEASNHLTEAMQKTASKIKTETKMVVSTESESTYESETASEIVNPNEEIPITYVYSKFLRQYEVFTSVAEVQNVIMVAERIPNPHEVNFEWVKRNDWIIAKVLLDDSFRDALSSISQAPKPIDYSQITDTLGSKLESIVGTGEEEGFLERFAGKLQGGSLSLAGVDMISDAQSNYRESLQRKFETNREIELVEIKRDRLYQHIRDNILHYCRAIWNHEDPQQRILRYKKLEKHGGIKIPLDWEFTGTLGYTSDSDAEVDDMELLLNEIERYETDEEEDTNFELEGEFIGDSDTSVYITDLINPAGLIGYQGNYAIYLVKPSFLDSDLYKILQIMKTPYLYYPPEDDTNGEIGPILMDPELKRLTIEVETSGKIPDDDDDDDDEKISMIDYIPELRARHAAAILEGDDAVDDLFDDVELFKKYYPEYLLRKKRTRRFLLDTYNLVIDIEPGMGTALETFKLAHRGIDILKTLEEKKAIELENKRREELLKEKKYDAKYWPGAQKVVIFDTEEKETSKKDEKKTG